jgi:hypothetical protein
MLCLLYKVFGFELKVSYSRLKRQSDIAAWVERGANHNHWVVEKSATHRLWFCLTRKFSLSTSLHCMIL